MKHVIIALVLCVAPTICFAKPVYLECYTVVDQDSIGGTAKLEYSRDKTIFTVALDEETGLVSNTSESGRVKRYNATFTANNIVYGSKSSSGTKSFQINRTSLEIASHSVGMYKGITILENKSYGVCQIKEIDKNRKI